MSIDSREILHKVFTLSNIRQIWVFKHQMVRYVKVLLGIPLSFQGNDVVTV